MQHSPEPMPQSSQRDHQNTVEQDLPATTHACDRHTIMSARESRWYSSLESPPIAQILLHRVPAIPTVDVHIESPMPIFRLILPSTNRVAHQDDSYLRSGCDQTPLQTTDLFAR